MIRTPSPIVSPRLALDEKGRPDVKPILREISASPKSNFPRNPKVYSPTPARSPATSNGVSQRQLAPSRSPSTSPIDRNPVYVPSEKKPMSPHSSPLLMVPQPVARTPTGQIKQRTVAAVADTTSRSELNRAQRESRRKAENNTFDEYTVEEPKTLQTKKEVLHPIQHVAKSDVNQMQNNIQTVMEIPLNHVAFKTSSGTYVMPDYGKYSKLQREHTRYDFEQKIDKLNKNWNKFGLYFDQPLADEDLTTTDIRWQDYKKVVKRKSGSNLWWILAGAVWLGVEYVLTQVLHLEADGYAANQLKQYKLYEMHMIEMGEGSGFGQDWPPWMQFCVTSALSAGVIVFMGTFFENYVSESGDIMKYINSIVTGQDVLELDADGNPIAPKEGLLDKLSKMDFENMDVSKGLALYRMFTGGSKKTDEKEASPPPKTKRTKEEIEKARAERNKRAAAADDD